MTSRGSITCYLIKLRAGDPAALQRLWEVYYRRLVALARTKLQGTSRRMADEEDVALSALYSFFRAAERGRFPKLNDRSDLWQLLVVITVRKVADLAQHERRQKRGGGAVETAGPGFGQVLGREPTPEFAAQVAEQYRRLLDILGDEDLRSVAVWKMEGYTAAEIAAKLECVPRTVERKLGVIRGLWERELEP